MALDPAPIGRLAAALMDMVERDYQGRPVELRAALVIVDVAVPDDEGESWTHVRWHFGSAADQFDTNVASSAYAAGLCVEALTGLTQGGEISDGNTS